MKIKSICHSILYLTGYMQYKKIDILSKRGAVSAIAPRARP